MSLPLRQPSPTYGTKLPDRDFFQDAVHISKFVNEDTDIPLQISYVHFNIERNGPAHRTHFYSCMNDPDKNILIVRRGQPFRITIGLSRKFCQRDYITLIFYSKDLCKTAKELEEDNGITSTAQTAKVVTLKSTFGNKTKIVVPVIATSHYSIKSTSKWDAVCDFVGNDYIQVLVQAADDCIIGRWLMSLCIEQDGIVSWFHESRKTTIYVIFNYTCKGDEVYLENITERTEYVEELMGMIFVGCEKHVMVNFWTFGQFDDVVLELAMRILLTTELTLDVSDRCRASKVAQVIAHGVLQSNKIFKNGNKHRDDPWSSASRVISEYFKKKKPIVYFEHKTVVAVLTSIFRSLGIPARPVSGYNISSNVFSRIPFRPPKSKPPRDSVSSKKSTKSAKSAKNTETIKKSVEDPELRVSSSTATDSATPVGARKKAKPKPSKLDRLFLAENLRVFFPWVEIFILRRDLGENSKGWQAISNFGPASVVAIQECDYTLEHNTILFSSWINNSYTYYSFNKTFQNLVPHNEVIGRLGNIVNTKKAGPESFGYTGLEKTYRSTQEQTIEANRIGFATNYKRTIEAHATTPATVISKFIGQTLQGLAFYLTPIKSILLGEAIPIHLFAASSDHRNEWQASVSVDIFAVSPNGNMLKKVKHSVMKLNKMIDGGNARLSVPFSEYGSKIQINGIFKVIAVAWATGMSEGYFLMDDFFIISIPPPQLLVFQNAMSISLINTLPIPMKHAFVTLYELGDTTPGVKLKVPMLVIISA